MHLKKILWRLLISMIAQMIFTPASMAVTYEITPNMRSCAVVRKSSTKWSDQIDCLRAGTDVRVLKYNPGGYSQISVGGKKRYVWTRFLKPVKEPVVAAKPPAAKPQVVKPEVKPEALSKPEEPIVQRPPPKPAEPIVQPPPSEKEKPLEAAAPAAETVPAISAPAEEIKPASNDIPEVAPVKDPPAEVQAAAPPAEMIAPSAAKPEEVVAQDVAEPPAGEQTADETTATKGPAPMCGGNRTRAPDMWKSVQSIMEKGVIPAGKTYDINGPSWPKLVRSGTKLDVEYGPNKKSMCTSATATAFMQHLADLVNAGAINLTDAQLEFINRRGEVKKNKKSGAISTKVGPIRNALNGDTNSVALLYQALGGQSVYGMRGKGGDTSKILAALKQARPGDVLKIDHRTNGRNYGHSTIFKEIKGNKVCYWSSAKKTKGVGVDCKPIANLIYATVSRLPADVCEIPKRLNQMMGDTTLASQLRTSSTHVAPNWIKWKTKLTEPQVRETAAVAADDVAGAQR